MGVFIARVLKKERSHRVLIAVEILGMIIAGLFMVAGYYVAEGVIYGNWTAPILGVPWNIGQFTVGMIVAISLAAALYKTSAAKFFEYRLDERK